MRGPAWLVWWRQLQFSFMFGKKIIVFDGSHYLKGQKEARTYYGLQTVRSQDQQQQQCVINSLGESGYQV